MKLSKRDRKVLFEVVGWLGAILIILAYILLVLKVTNVDALLFHVLNLIGAVCLITISLFKRTHQTAIVNAVMAIVAIIAIINIFV